MQQKHYSVLKRNDILRYATKWVNGEGIKLNEISETPRHKYCMIPLLRNEVPRVVKFTEKKVDLWLPGAGGAGRENGELWFK